MNRKKPYGRRRRSKKQQEFINSLLFFVVSVLSIAGLLTYLWVYNEINVTARENAGLGRIRRSIATENVELRNEIARLTRIDRITEIAENDLKMVTPRPETLVVFINPEILGDRAK